MTNIELFKASTKFFTDQQGTMNWLVSLAKKRGITKTADAMSAIVDDYKASNMHGLRKDDTTTDLALYINMQVNG